MSTRRASIYKTVLHIALLAAVVVLNWQCRTLRAWQALRQVDFYIDRVSDVNLAGVELDHVRSYEDLTLEQTLRISQALARGTLPLRFQLHLIAENPADNPVTARLERLEWTLLLDDHPTLSGTLDQTYRLRPANRRKSRWISNWTCWTSSKRTCRILSSWPWRWPAPKGSRSASARSAAVHRNAARSLVLSPPDSYPDA